MRIPELRLAVKFLRNYRTTIILLFFFSSRTAYSQAPEPAIDSIQKLLYDVPLSKEKASLYNQLGSLYQKINIDSAMKYARLALAAAEEEKNIPQIIRAYERKAVLYRLKNDYAKSAEMCKKVMVFYEEAGDRCGQAKILNNLGIMYRDRGISDTAIEYLSRALNVIHEKCDIKGLLPTILLNTAGSYEIRGEYKKAQEYNFRALKEYEKTGQADGVAYTLSSIGTIFYRLGQMKKSLEFYKKALDKSRQADNKKLIASCLYNIGHHYLNDKKFTVARNYLDQALQIQNQAGIDKGNERILLDMGLTYQGENDYVKSRDYFRRVLNLSQKSGSNMEKINSMIYLGDNYKITGNASLAKDYFLQAIELAKQSNLPAQTGETLVRISETYALLGDYEKAYDYHREYKSLSDSLFNLESAGQINELTTKYESEKKDNEITLLNKDIALKNITLARNRYLIGGLSGAVVLVVLFIFLIVNGNKQRIRRKTAEIEMKLLRARMDPHFIFNALNAVQNYQLKGDTKEAAMYLAKFASLMRTVLESSFREFIPLEEEIKGLKNYLDLQSLRFRHSFDYSIDIDPSIDPEAVSVPSMLAQPIIENALEHGIVNAKDRGKIDISFKMENGKVLFSVSDNGPGPAEPVAAMQAVKNSPHQSRAVEITTERLALLEKKKVKKIKIFPEKILDKTATIIGAKVMFYIPFKTS